MKTKSYKRKKYKASWTKERRLTQSKRCKEQKPWERSTGPVTNEGKKKISQNAYKHGGRGQRLINIAKILSAQSRFLNEFARRMKLNI